MLKTLLMSDKLSRNKIGGNTMSLTELQEKTDRENEAQRINARITQNGTVINTSTHKPTRVENKKQKQNKVLIHNICKKIIRENRQKTPMCKGNTRKLNIGKKL